MRDLNIVGYMMVRNEQDIVIETVTEAFRWIDTLVVLDGVSNDGTTDKLIWLQSSWCKEHGKTLDLHIQPDPDDRFSLNIRNELLRLTGLHKPDWVLSVDADEIYHCDPKMKNDPRSAIIAAEANKANVVRCHVPQFWLTFADLRRGALHEDESISVQERRRWYSWGHAGTFIWRWNDHHYYPTDESKRTPELPGLTWRQWQIAGPIMPICKHYCIRGLIQGVTRVRERMGRGDRRYFGKYWLNWLIDEQRANLHYLALYDETWNRESNHDDLYAYMGGQHKE